MALHKALVGCFLVAFTFVFVDSSVIFSNVNVDQFFEKVDSQTAEKHWALLVAGSSGWYNYRHQADICHAYQVMKKHGIPDERIVVMMYDDIADNEENPTPGKIINHPKGKDVYHGVLKDYTGKDVTPENFLKILSGDEEAMRGIGSGKVIKSGPNDHVFVNFADHGAPGLVAFPYGELEARDLQRTIKKMYEDKKYAQIVFYIEACESGSMFNKLLPKNINVYATTAANPSESSYACYYDEDRNTYLGDVYSVKWMEDSDSENLDTETLYTQYKIVKKETNTSHVMEYGDFKISKESVGEFQGGAEKRGKMRFAMSPKLPSVPLNAVPVQEVPLSILHRKLMKAQTPHEQEALLKKLQAEIKMREMVADTMKSIVNLVTGNQAETLRILNSRAELSDFDCYEPAARRFSKSCFKLSKNLYALRHLYALVNLCEAKYSAMIIDAAILQVCMK